MWEERAERARRDIAALATSGMNLADLYPAALAVVQRTVPFEQGCWAGVDPQTLIDALVASRSSAIDNLLEAGAITQDQADGYLEALTEAFTFRVTWDGEEETPTFSSLDA